MLENEVGLEPVFYAACPRCNSRQLIELADAAQPVQCMLCLVPYRIATDDLREVVAEIIRHISQLDSSQQR